MNAISKPSLFALYNGAAGNDADPVSTRACLCDIDAAAQVTCIRRPRCLIGAPVPRGIGVRSIERDAKNRRCA